MTNAQSRPLGFLELPTELRLMVYELLPNRTIRTRYVKRSSEGTTESSFTIITYTAPTAILATCKTINNEAAAILLKTTQQIVPGVGTIEQYSSITGNAPRIETESLAFPILGASKGPIKAAIDWYSCLQTTSSSEFTTFLDSHGYDVSSLLRGYGYVMEGGEFEEGVRRLLNFIRKSGCVLHVRRNNVCLSNITPVHPYQRDFQAHPSRNFHVVVTKGAGDPDDTVNAVKDFGRALGVLDPIRDIRVSIHALDPASEWTGAAVRAGETSFEYEIIDERRGGHPGITSILALGETTPATFCKEDYDQFWRAGEWKL